MARRFRRTHDGVEARLEPGEAALLRDLVEDLLPLLAADEVAGDPVLARLFPDGYRDDPEAAAELRSLIQDDLRAGKRAALQTVLDGLSSRNTKGRVLLDTEAASAWLGGLNDLRLSLGTRLGVTEETYDELDLPAPDGDDPRRQALEIYAWLGWLQESLVETLMS
ncbi:MAG TPA: DUF2017 domain-containing protein [Mycobacteriales bacterium]|nr:DUF2017 domain-containing protein [Mycobacteriales bacterium]